MEIKKSEKGNMNNNETKMAVENSSIAIFLFAIPYIAEEILKIDMGEFTPIVGAIITGILFFLKERYNITTVRK